MPSSNPFIDIVVELNSIHSLSKAAPCSGFNLSALIPNICFDLAYAVYKHLRRGPANSE